ncbi:hypothetical protein [Dyella subtropica]|uniref:hypothetical protein n=1 Tax=Dyella subtropica TaxID=2992127 RepID=UPI0022583076|nr:hypothetical protein [Dyella subtropica]
MTTLLPSRLARRIAIALSLVVSFAALEGCDTYNCAQCHNFAFAPAKLVYGHAHLSGLNHVRMGP